MLIGVYSPANRDESRDEFRLGFLSALDARVRNLVAAGKRVFLTGDLNIIREEIDTANAEEQLKQQGLSGEEYLSTPARRLLNQLLAGGKVIGERDEGREKPVMWDICRSFHTSRKGMFTCWNQKINARPGNFGSRIDYVLCSEDWKHWFGESDIQEGLMGSDHCPVYAVLKEKVEINGTEVNIRDIMSSGMFKDGVKQREWSVKDLLPTSAKLIPEFDRRRNIRDMFTRKQSLSTAESSLPIKLDESQEAKALEEDAHSENGLVLPTRVQTPSATEDATLESQNSMPSPAKPSGKRASETSSSARPVKRGKSGSASKQTSIGAKGQPGKGQSSLMGFFKPSVPQSDGQADSQSSSVFDADSDTGSIAPSNDAVSEPPMTPRSVTGSMSSFADGNENVSPNKSFNPDDQKKFVDPIVSKESWSKLLGKRVVPRCEHNEPCISLVTKKPGVNCGRSFYICPRPLGPSGQKERNTQWRCGTFIWSSDWTGDER